MPPLERFLNRLENLFPQITEPIGDIESAHSIVHCAHDMYYTPTKYVSIFNFTPVAGCVFEFAACPFI